MSSKTERDSFFSITHRMSSMRRMRLETCPFRDSRERERLARILRILKIHLPLQMRTPLEVPRRRLLRIEVLIYTFINSIINSIFK
jgi:hypothetical protein